MNAGDVLNDKYRIEKLLGQGGMGAVYLAENQDVGRKVAIKLLRPEFAADLDVMTRFKNEARAAAAIGHPGIVDVLDMGTTPQGAPFIVMERLLGETLRQRLLIPPPMSIDQAVGLIVKVLDVLGAAHAAGVIHRDLKPDNIFVQRQPPDQVKILDFGISKFHSGPGAHVTQTGQVMGTPLYMSPEQAKGSRDAGITADLYSMGAILYEVLAGRPPYPGENYTEILAKLLTEPLPPLASIRPGLPPMLCAVVERLLDKNPVNRFATAAETAEALRSSLGPGTGPVFVRSISGEVPALGQTTPSAQRMMAHASRAALAATATPPSAQRSERVRAGGILAGGLVLSGAIWFFGIRQPEAPPPAPIPAVTPPLPATAPPPPAVAAAPPTPPETKVELKPPPVVDRPAEEEHTPHGGTSHGHHRHEREEHAAVASAKAPPAVEATAVAASSPVTSPAADPPVLAGRFAGAMDEDSKVLTSPPSPVSHIHVSQVVTIAEAGGQVSATFDGPPPCTIHLTRQTPSTFTVAPGQCEVGSAKATREMRIVGGHGALEGSELDVTFSGTVPAKTGGMISFTSSFHGARKR